MTNGPSHTATRRWSARGPSTASRSEVPTGESKRDLAAAPTRVVFIIGDKVIDNDDRKVVSDFRRSRSPALGHKIKSISTPRSSCARRSSTTSTIPTAKQKTV